MPPDQTLCLESRSAKLVAVWLLSVVVVAYWLICLPAIERRGYPPIDHIWTAVTGLWVFPVPIFILFVPAGLFSRRALFCYAIATGFIDACTMLTLVPNPHSLLLWVFNFVFTGPVHLIVTCLIAGVGRLFLRSVGLSSETAIASPTPTRSLLRMAIIIVVAASATAFPFVMRRSATNSETNYGITLADQDWDTQKAVIYRRNGHEEEMRDVGDVEFSSSFDTDSGLPLEHDWLRGFEPGYNARIQELLKSHGVPTWSLKSRFVGDADLLSMFASREMNEVTKFPTDLTPNIALFRKDFGRWGQMLASGEDGPGLATKYGKDWPKGGPDDRIFVGRLDKYPGTIFVRCEQKWVTACTEDGWILETAKRSHSYFPAAKN